MVKLSVAQMLERVNNEKKKVVIVGTGIMGRYALAHLRKDGTEPFVFLIISWKQVRWLMV